MHHGLTRRWKSWRSVSIMYLDKAELRLSSNKINVWSPLSKGQNHCSEPNSQRCERCCIIFSILKMAKSLSEFQILEVYLSVCPSIRPSVVHPVNSDWLPYNRAPAYNIIYIYIYIANCCGLILWMQRNICYVHFGIQVIFDSPSLYCLTR